MGDDGDNSDLWEEAWSRREPPAGEPVRSRPKWEPGEAGVRRADRASSHARHSRRVAEIGGRDAHLTFEPPEEYRPDHVERHRDTSARGAAARDTKRKRREVGATKAPRHPGPKPFLPGGVRMPRGTVVGYRRRFRGGAPLVAVVVLVVVAIVAALAWWLLTRPAALALTLSPSDAIVSVAGHGMGTGTLTLDSLEPGTLTATVARSGFETATVGIEVLRGRAGCGPPRTGAISTWPASPRATCRAST